MAGVRLFAAHTAQNLPAAKTVSPHNLLNYRETHVEADNTAAGSILHSQSTTVHTTEK